MSNQAHCEKLHHIGDLMGTFKSRALWSAIIVAVLIPKTGNAQDYRYSAPRNATVNAAGARLIRVEAGAGFLHINGRPNTSEVRVTGVAGASSRRLLDEIKLIAVREGDVVRIKMDVPDQDRGFFDMIRGDWQQALDLTIDVPINVPLEVEDGSGETVIRGTNAVTVDDGSGDLELKGITGNVKVHDGSGNISLSGIDGDVYVDDGSGNISANNVTGNFTVGDDGSGGIDVEGVSGTMRVDDKGSGSIHVSRVGGDFIVGDKGSGGIEFDTVKGRVSIPERHGRRGRSYE
jgi:hypothetical protein